MPASRSAALGSAFCVAACRTPTQVTVEIATDLSCDEHPDTMAQVGRIGADLEQRPVAIATTACGAAGRIGSFVVVPSGELDDEFAVKVIVGHGNRSAAGCRAAEAASSAVDGCIFARRGLRFLPHTELDLPILMRADCDGIACGPTTTCVHGSCRTAIIDDPGLCHGKGCLDPPPNPVDAGTVFEGGDAESGAPDGDDADAGESAPPVMSPSCSIPLPCGTSNESCCTSLPVTGSDFLRKNDPDYPASVSSFRLDKFETTVGRFRAFVAATSAGWLPAAGSGKHVHLAGGGLYSINDKAIETGWDPQWSARLPQAKTVWDNTLDCNGTDWTPAPGPNESRPIVCVNWYEAYAFCIWDGGFLPSYAEWNFAAAGGKEQRFYAWGDTPPPDMSHARYCDTASCGTIINVGSLPLGNGRYGQSDLAGNAFEYTLDSGSAVTSDPCTDCLVYNRAITDHATVSGGFDAPVSQVQTDYNGFDDASYRDLSNGFRCARPP